MAAIDARTDPDVRSCEAREFPWRSQITGRNGTHPDMPLRIVAPKVTGLSPVGHYPNFLQRRETENYGLPHPYSYASMPGSRRAPSCRTYRLQTEDVRYFRN